MLINDIVKLLALSLYSIPRHHSGEHGNQMYESDVCPYFKQTVSVCDLFRKISPTILFLFLLLILLFLITIIMIRRRLIYIAPLPMII